MPERDGGIIRARGPRRGCAHCSERRAQCLALLDRIDRGPLDLAVARTSTRLDFEGDAADQLIAATSLVHGVPLLTRDRRIRRSKVVPLA